MFVLTRRVLLEPIVLIVFAIALATGWLSLERLLLPLALCLTADIAWLALRAPFLPGIRRRRAAREAAWLRHVARLRERDDH